jgi:hypothetical protein
MRRLFRSAGAVDESSCLHPTAPKFLPRPSPGTLIMPWSGGAKWWHVTIAEIAAAEKINESYVGRVLRLTLLAPDTVEAILGGRQSTDMTLAMLMRPFAVAWTEQRKTDFCWKMLPPVAARRTQDEVAVQSKSSIV